MGRIDQARLGGTNFAPAQTLWWIAEAALGLEYLHSHSMIHGDLRARRLLLDHCDHVVVSGFGLSPLLSQVSKTDYPDADAVRYLSPEIVLGGEPSTTADVWALGIVLYELVTLQNPLERSHPRETADRILAAPVPPLPCSCSPELKKIASTLLQHDPGARASMGALLRMPVLQERMWSMVGEEPLPRQSWTLTNSAFGQAAESTSLLNTPFPVKKPQAFFLQEIPGPTPRSLMSISERAGNTMLQASPTARLRSKGDTPVALTAGFMIAGAMSSKFI